MSLLNEIKASGAEAISVNDQRIVYNNYVVDINNTPYISVNEQRCQSLYVVKVIGDQTNLDNKLSNGYIKTATSEGKSVTLQKQDNISIGKYTRNIGF